MAYIICLEGSTDTCSVALCFQDQVRQLEEKVESQNHSADVLPYITSCLKREGITFRDLAAVAISGGPGSYTGLRVVATTAKALCFAHQIPMIAVNTLEILSYSRTLEPGTFLMPMVDARRDEVYMCVYDDQRNLLLNPTPMILEEEELPDFRGKKIHACGNGASKAVALLNQHQIELGVAHTSAAYLATPAWNRFIHGEFEDIIHYSPSYIKEPNITISKKNLFESNLKR